jgi:hydroxyacylglutathione hydrolase
VSAPPTDLGEGVWQFQTQLWQTNSLLATADGAAIVCDPCWAPAEIEAIRAGALEAGGPVYLLVTHADYDHTCGIGTFTDATVVAGLETAAAVTSGRAAAALAVAGEEWGLDWPGELRVDMVVDGDSELALGSFTVRVVDCPSHGREGVGYVLVEQGVLFPGDHLSPITIPLLGGSLERTISANERLLDAIARHELRWVVPGHGPALTPPEAREIGEADLAYLIALRAAAAEAVADGLSPGWALLQAYAVEPPRPDTNDFAVYGIRTGNARVALEEAR